MEFPRIDCEPDDYPENIYGLRLQSNNQSNTLIYKGRTKQMWGRSYRSSEVIINFELTFKYKPSNDTIAGDIRWQNYGARIDDYLSFTAIRDGMAEY